MIATHNEPWTVVMVDPVMIDGICECNWGKGRGSNTWIGCVRGYANRMYW